mmetsp:Transcript_52627/g.93916  ORF Transcript_52627/g.93916 Transcript_52627/m.93916 type:complete len:463 (-) Transcript_52627:87-1475(-)
MSNPPALFVGGLPAGADEPLLKGLFEQFGTIESTTVKKGYGFVQFAQHGSNELAVTLDGLEIQGKKLGVRVQTEDNMKKSAAPAMPLSIPAGVSPAALAALDPQKPPTLFIGSLPAEVTESEVRALVTPFGAPKSITVKRGYAFVTFEDPQAAKSACALNGHVYGDRALGVRIQAAENMKGKKVIAVPQQLLIPQMLGGAQMLGLPRVASIPMGMGVRPAGVLAPPLPGRGPAGPTKPGHSLFMGGLPGDSTEDEVRMMAEAFGSIESIAMFKGFCFVNYAQEGSAAQAAEHLDGLEYMGRKLGVRVQEQRPAAPALPALQPMPIQFPSPMAAAFASPFQALPGMLPGAMPGGGLSRAPVAPSQPKVGPSLFVGGLPPTASERDLHLLCSPYGTVVKLHLHKGYCFVDYGTEGAAAKAASILDGYNMDGKTLGVRVQDERENAAGKYKPSALGTASARFAPY